MSRSEGIKKRKAPYLERYTKRVTLDFNKRKGKMAEDFFELNQKFQGNAVKRTPIGRDFEVQKKDFISGKNIGKPTSYEIKTGNSRLSDAQKKRQKRGRYKVIRT